MKPIVGALGAVLTSAALTPAAARPNRVDQMPNTIGCAMCHVDPGGGGVRTPVGDDTLLALSGNDVVWADLCVLDSDGDMLSNGAELGDPDCIWRRGQPVPPVQSDPNDSDDPVEGAGAGGMGGNVGPDRFCLEACEIIADCAVEGDRCPELAPADQADAARLCAQECVDLPALPIAVERAGDCQEMVQFLAGASPLFAETCGVDLGGGEGGAGGEIDPVCETFCERIIDCAAPDACPDADRLAVWCPDACANQPALRVLIEEAADCGAVRATLEAASPGYAALCDQGAGGEGGMGGVGGEGGQGGMGGAAGEGGMGGVGGEGGMGGLGGEGGQGGMGGVAGEGGQGGMGGVAGEGGQGGMGGVAGEGGQGGMGGVAGEGGMDGVAGEGGMGGGAGEGGQGGSAPDQGPMTDMDPPVATVEGCTHHAPPSSSPLWLAGLLLGLLRRRR